MLTTLLLYKTQKKLKTRYLDSTLFNIRKGPIKGPLIDMVDIFNIHVTDLILAQFDLFYLLAP